MLTSFLSQISLFCQWSVGTVCCVLGPSLAFTLKVGVQVRAWALATSQTVDSRRPSSKWGLKIKHGILSWVDRTGKWRGFGPWPSWTLDFRLLLLF